MINNGHVSPVAIDFQRKIGNKPLLLGISGTDSVVGFGDQAVFKLQV